MKKLTKKNLEILNRLVKDYNSYSELVALNYYRKHEEGITQWNRGSLSIIREYLEDFAKSIGVELTFTCGTHPFLDLKLEYITASYTTPSVD